MVFSDARRATVIRRFLRQPTTIAGLALAALVLLFSVAGMAFWKHSWTSLAFPRYAEPGMDHPLGTDGLGGDMVAQVSRGIWNSLPVAVAVAVAVLAGAALGALAHLLRRHGRPALARIADVLLVGLGITVVVLVLRGFHLPARFDPQPGFPDGGSVRLPFALPDVGWLWLAPILALTVGTVLVRGLVRRAVPETPELVAALVGLAVGFALAFETNVRDVVFGMSPRWPEPSLDALWWMNRHEFDTHPWLLLAPTVFLVVLPFAAFLVGLGVADATEPATRRSSSA